MRLVRRIVPKSNRLIPDTARRLGEAAPSVRPPIIEVTVHDTESGMSMNPASVAVFPRTACAQIGIYADIDTSTQAAKKTAPLIDAITGCFNSANGNSGVLARRSDT